MSEFKERGMLFNDEMVRAILEGRKTQTRRVIKGVDGKNWLKGASNHVVHAADHCPYGQPGDRLWVREAHAIVPRTAYAQSVGVDQILKPDDDHDAAIFRAGWERSKPGPWRPSIHMPRWASRITLDITDVRVERLQDISTADAKAEGGPTHGHSGAEISHRRGFRHLWSQINGPDSWDANPWVWVIEFRRID